MQILLYEKFPDKSVVMASALELQANRAEGTVGSLVLAAGFLQQPLSSYMVILLVSCDFFF